MKAQASFEYLVIVSIVIIAVGIIGTYVYQQNQLGTASKQAEIAANVIKSAADNVYAQGPGAKSTITVVFPDGYYPQQSKVANYTIQIAVSTPYGINTIVATTKGNISGSLPNGPGTKVLTLELIDGYVNVTSS